MSLVPVGKSQLPSNSPSDHWYFCNWSDHNHHRQKQQIENQDWQPDGEFVMSVMSSTIFKSSTIYNSGDQRKLCKTAKAIWYVVDFWPFQRDKNKSCCFHMKSHKTDTSLTFASLKLYSDAWSLFPHGTGFASSFVPKMPKPSSLIWKLQKWSLRNVEFLFCTFWRSHPRLPKIYLKITNDLWICKNDRWEMLNLFFAPFERANQGCWVFFLLILLSEQKEEIDGSIIYFVISSPSPSSFIRSSEFEFRGDILIWWALVGLAAKSIGEWMNLN